MPTLALAFHESAAMDELRRFFSDSESPESAGTYPVTCSKCLVTFAVVVLDRHDPDCPSHRAALAALIEDDCAAGLHRQDYELVG